MRNLGIIAVLSMLLVAFAASAALGASPHFTKTGIPTCSITGSGQSRDISCTGELAGLGNGDLSTLVTAAGSATYACGAPGNDNPAPGQNKVPLQLGDSTPTVIPGSDIKNGRTTFTDATTLTAPDPNSVTPSEAGCANDNWQVSFLSLVVTNVTVQVSQGGDLILTCSRTNQNGLPSQFTFRKSECTFA